MTAERCVATAAKIRVKLEAMAFDWTGNDERHARSALSSVLVDLRFVMLSDEGQQ
jgi:hypothetical protein